MKHLPLWLLAILFASCANTVTKGTANVESAQIENGVTTESDLIAQLGPPQGHGLDSQGRKMLTWNRLQVANTSKAFIPMVGPFLPGSESVKKDQLVVSFAANGRVADHRIVSEHGEGNMFGETGR